MDDLISRQVVLDGKMVAVISGQAIDVVPASYIKDLPFAQPERMMARWEDAHRSKLDGTFHWFIKCNNCGYERKDDDHDLDTEYMFCPSCGADMREETTDG